MPHELRLAVISAPPLGHAARVMTALTALCDLVDFHADVFVPRSINAFKHFPLPNVSVHEIRCPTRDWLSQGETFAAELSARGVPNSYDLLILDTNPVQWLYLVDTQTVPSVFITNAFLARPSPTLTLQEIYFRKNHFAINQRRAAMQLPTVSSSYELFDAELVMFADPQEITSLYESSPISAHSVGGHFWSSPTPLPPELESLSDLMILSLGSTGDASALTADILQQLQHASGSKHIILAGNAFGLPQTISNMLHSSWPTLPLSQIAERSKLFVTQGGAGSTYQALASDKPVYVVPRHQNHVIMGQILRQLDCGSLATQSKYSEPWATEDINRQAQNARRLKVSPNGPAEHAIAQKIYDFASHRAIL